VCGVMKDVGGWSGVGGDEGCGWVEWCVCGMMKDVGGWSGVCVG